MIHRAARPPLTIASFDLAHAHVYYCGDMAIDIVAACEASESAAAPQSFFVGMSVLFAFYIGLDAVIAALVVRRKLRDHNASPTALAPSAVTVVPGVKA